MTTTARTVRLLQVRYAPSPEGPWSEPTTVVTSHDLSDWCSPAWYGNNPEQAYRQDRVIELPLPPDDAPEQLNESAFTPVEWDGRQLVKKADGVNDGEVAEPKYEDLLRELLETQDARDAALREAAGVREELEQLRTNARADRLAQSQLHDRHADALMRAESAEKRLAEAEALNEALKRGQLDCMSALESAERDVVILRGIRDRAWDKLRELGITVMP